MNALRQAKLVVHGKRLLGKLLSPPTSRGGFESFRVLRKLEGGDHWDDVGTNQFRFLLREGLKPTDYLLDVACGSFRGGRFFIEYLESGHYFGVDGDAKHIDMGIKYVLQPRNLLAKKPNVCVVKLTPEPIEWARLLGFGSFDCVWIHALFDHIPPETIRQGLNDLPEVMAPGGKLYATIFLNPFGPKFREPMIRPRDGSLRRAVVTFPDREYWHHAIEFFEEHVIATRKLRLDECIYDYPHPLGLRILRFIRQ